MPRRSDLNTILVIGAGPIIIGQACEFDYSGAQACKALREEGYREVLVKDALNADQKTIKPLFDALRRASSENRDISEENGVTIMGDKEIPYGLLKKIMLTCAGADYTNISFAVTQKAAES